MASTLKELRSKLETFMIKHVVKVNKAAIKELAKLPELVDFLLKIDEHIPAEDFFKHTGLDLFPTLFKLTFYGHTNSVVNSSLNGFIGSLEIQ